MLPACPCNTCGEPMPVAPGASVLACDSCGTKLHGRPASRRLQDPDWVALAPKAKLRYADDTAEALVAPDALVPFRIERATARRLLREWAQRQWFAPRALRRIDESESFRGAFLPYWVWEARTRTRYKAARGEHYWSGTGGGRVRKIRWMPAAGRVYRDFTAVPVAATVRLEGRALADLLRDWRIGDAVRFTPAMLDGYWVQRYNLEPEVGLELAKARMAAAVEAEVRECVGGDEQYVPSIETAYSGLAYRLVLLPVWLVSYPYRGRRLMVAVHGQSGRVVGERPWSAAKQVFTTVLTSGVAGIIQYFGRLSLSHGLPGPPGGRGIAYAMLMLYGSWNATRQLSCACIPRSVQPPPAAPRHPTNRSGRGYGQPDETRRRQDTPSPWWAKTMVVVGSTVMVISGGGAIAAQVSVNVLEDSVNQANLLDDQRVEVEEGAQITGPPELPRARHRRARGRRRCGSHGRGHHRPRQQGPDAGQHDLAAARPVRGDSLRVAGVGDEAHRGVRLLRGLGRVVPEHGRDDHEPHRDRVQRRRDRELRGLPRHGRRAGHHRAVPLARDQVDPH